MAHDKENQVRSEKSGDILYDRGTMKVVVFACFIIILAVVLTGGVSYFITRNAVVEKLKSRDLVNIIESIAAKVDGRIERATETSLALAQDPAINQWISGAEKDEGLGVLAKAKINDIAQKYDYANSFIVSAITKHYWAENSQMIQIMNEEDPNAAWFFAALKSGKAIDINIDYNVGRKNTFVFLNALMGDVSAPIAVTGVGLSMEEISQEFQSYKIGQTSNLWLVDGQGKIHLSDNIEHNGTYLKQYIPAAVTELIIKETDIESARAKVMEYKSVNGETMDLTYKLTKNTDWKLVFQLPRRESIAVLGNIKLNTVIASLIAVILIIFIFYTVSRRIANPLKRAVMLAQEMGKQVDERTRELAEKNQKIIDSIDYAKRLQESVLPSLGDLKDVFQDGFILWRPRDIVGGDLYWVRRIDENRSMAAVVDCTGHGVPGAFMTMAVNTILNQIIDEKYENPAAVIAELNRRVKKTLHRNAQNGVTDDGLDIGICLIAGNKQIMFAGAKISLFVKRGNQVRVLKGDNRSIGYHRSRNDLVFSNQAWDIEEGDQFYLSTDGYLDQNGGQKDYPFGRERFIKTIRDMGNTLIAAQQQAFEKALHEYMGNEMQRDDITVIGFCV